MTVDYCKPSQVVSSLAVAVLDVVLLSQQINTSSGTWHAAIDLANSLFHSRPPEATCFQLARPVVYFHQPNLGVYQLSSSLS